MTSLLGGRAKNLDIEGFAAIVRAGFAAGQRVFPLGLGGGFFGDSAYLADLMYAVIRTGGKQYRVAKNDVIKIERLPGDEGSTIKFDEVLMVEDAGQTTIGTPLVVGAAVTATVLEQGKGDKIIVFKKKRRKNYRRRNGHRQFETVVRIADIHPAG